MTRPDERASLRAPGQPGQMNLPVACPFCGSTDVELLSLFGSQLLTDQYYCRACRTPFEHLRADVADTVDIDEHESHDVSGPAGRVSREE